MTGGLASRFPAGMTNQASATDLRAELGSRTLPRHLALFYRSRESQLAATTAFLVEGLQSDYHCIYLLDVNTASDIKDALQSANIEVKQRIEAGDLVIHEASDVYLDSGFDPSQMIATLEDEAEASVADGYEGLWIAGENSWCFHTDHNFDLILDFEADFDAVCPDLPVTALCQYDLTRFNEESAAKALWTHEQIIYRNQLCENPFYISPEDYRSMDSPHLNAQLMLEQAYSLTNARHNIAAREQRLDIVNRVLRHNIRNDLNLVKGTLELLAETESLSAESQQRLETAIDHAESVIEMAEKARYIQRATGDATLEPQPLRSILETAIEKATETYSVGEVQLTGNSDITVLADANLGVALREAIENGFAHQDTDSPTVSVSVSTPSEDTARIDIRNEGEIPDADQYSLEQGEETPLEHASGLGLWLIKWIVENAHGTLEFPGSDGGEAHLRIELYRVPA